MPHAALSTCSLRMSTPSLDCALAALGAVDDWLGVRHPALRAGGGVHCLLRQSLPAHHHALGCLSLLHQRQRPNLEGAGQRSSVPAPWGRLVTGRSLQYLLPSRCCQSDKLSALATSIVGIAPSSHQHITRLRDWIHDISCRRIDSHDPDLMKISISWRSGFDPISQASGATHGAVHSMTY